MAKPSSSGVGCTHAASSWPRAEPVLNECSQWLNERNGRTACTPATEVGADGRLGFANAADRTLGRTPRGGRARPTVVNPLSRP